MDDDLKINISLYRVKKYWWIIYLCIELITYEKVAGEHWRSYDRCVSLGPTVCDANKRSTEAIVTSIFAGIFWPIYWTAKIFY